MRGLSPYFRARPVLPGPGLVGDIGEPGAGRAGPGTPGRMLPTGGAAGRIIFSGGEMDRPRRACRIAMAPGVIGGLPYILNAP